MLVFLLYPVNAVFSSTFSLLKVFSLACYTHIKVFHIFPAYQPCKYTRILKHQEITRWKRGNLKKIATILQQQSSHFQWHFKSLDCKFFKWIKEITSYVHFFKISKVLKLFQSIRICLLAKTIPLRELSYNTEVISLGMFVRNND